MRAARPTSVKTTRRGVGALDYILALAVAFPLIGIFVMYGIRIIRSVYEMICVWVAWPFL